MASATTSNRVASQVRRASTCIAAQATRDRHLAPRLTDSRIGPKVDALSPSPGFHSPVRSARRIGLPHGSNAFLVT
jgi:hypothetical protein